MVEMLVVEMGKYKTNIKFSEDFNLSLNLKKIYVLK